MTFRQHHRCLRLPEPWRRAACLGVLVPTAVRKCCTADRPLHVPTQGASVIGVFGISSPSKSNDHAVNSVDVFSCRCHVRATYPHSSRVPATVATRGATTEMPSLKPMANFRKMAMFEETRSARSDPSCHADDSTLAVELATRGVASVPTPRLPIRFASHVPCSLCAVTDTVCDMVILLACGVFVPLFACDVPTVSHTDCHHVIDASLAPTLLAFSRMSVRLCNARWQLVTTVRSTELVHVRSHEGTHGTSLLIPHLRIEGFSRRY